MLHALLGTQPLLIIRPTGPITAILTKLCTLADSLSVDIYQLLAATGICVSVLMCAIAFSGFSKHIKRFTPFTYEIFACFVCSIYLHDGISDVFQRFAADNLANFGSSLFDLNLALLVFFLAVKLQARAARQSALTICRVALQPLLLHQARRVALLVLTILATATPQGARDWRFFPAILRDVISDYAVTIAVVAATFTSYAFDLVSAEVRA